MLRQQPNNENNTASSSARTNGGDGGGVVGEGGHEGVLVFQVAEVPDAEVPGVTPAGQHARRDARPGESSQNAQSRDLTSGGDGEGAQKRNNDKKLWRPATRRLRACVPKTNLGATHKGLRSFGLDVQQVANGRLHVRYQLSSRTPLQTALSKRNEKALPRPSS